MSAATTPSQAPPGAGPGNTPIDAACPLCGTPLDPAQEWCLSCGAAARTRLAAPTNWKAPLAAIAVVAALALGVLAASLVKLSSDSGTAKAPPPVTTTITASAPVTPGAVPTTAGGATGATGGAGAAGTGGVTGPGGATQGTGAITPGTPTTLTPTSTSGARLPGGSSSTAPAPKRPASAEEALRKAGFLPRTRK